MSITCFTGGGDFGVDLYIASLTGGTMSGNAMPAYHTHTHMDISIALARPVRQCMLH